MKEIGLTNECYLIDGVAGFIGSRISAKLISLGKQVVGIDNLITGSLDNLRDSDSPLFTFIRADITNEKKMDSIFQQDKFDVIFHNACSKCLVCRDNPKLDLLTNAYGTLNLAQLSVKYKAKRFIYASTGSTTSLVPSLLNKYPEYNYYSRQEVPLSFYGVSKLMAEKYLSVLHNYYPEFRYSILRYFHVYGSYQGKDIGVVPIFINRILNNQPIIIYGNGEQIRCFTTVDDIVTANLIASETDELDYKTFDVVSDITCSISKLVELLFNIFGYTVPLIYEPEKLGDIRKFQVDNSLIKKYGLRFNNDLEGELRKLVEWYRNEI